MVLFIIIQVLLSTVDIITGIYLLRGIFQIRAYLKTKGDSTDTKFFLLHAVAFSIYLVVHVIEGISNNLVIIYNDNKRSIVAFEIIILLVGFFSFVS